MGLDSSRSNAGPLELFLFGECMALDTSPMRAAPTSDRPASKVSAVTIYSNAHTSRRGVCRSVCCPARAHRSAFRRRASMILEAFRVAAHDVPLDCLRHADMVYPLCSAATIHRRRTEAS